MHNLWNRIRQLEGRTLRTDSRQRAFDILEVEDDRIWFSPQSTGKRRYLYRRHLEELAALGLPPRELNRARIQEELPYELQNSSYIYAILKSVGIAA